MSEWANCWFFWAKRSLAHLIAKIERFAQKTWLGHICNNISSRTWPYLRQYLFPDLRHLYDNISTLTWPDLLQYTVFALTWPYLWHYLYPDMSIFATIYMPWLGHICNNILTLTWPYLWQYLYPDLAIFVTISQPLLSHTECIRNQMRLMKYNENCCLQKKNIF